MDLVAETRAEAQISSPTTGPAISSGVAPHEFKNTPNILAHFRSDMVKWMKYVSALRTWTTTQWIIAGLGGLTTFLAIGLPTDVIDNPVFGRAIDETPWAMPVLIITSVLAALLVGTYVNAQPFDRAAKSGSFGGMLAFFAVGCPVCNKLVLIALGTTGAVNYFEPVQPYLAVLGIAALAYAFHKRIVTASFCSVAPALK